MLQGVSCLGGGSKYRRGSEDCERPVVRHLFHLFTLKGALRAPIKCDDCLRLAQTRSAGMSAIPPLLGDKRTVIVTGSNPNTVAAMKATKTIPIVMTNTADAVSAGFVASLARPGGNVTGLALDTGREILGKPLELLKETLPKLSRAGILWNPDVPQRSRLTSTMEAARALGLTLVSVEARGLNALEQAFETMVREQMQAFILLTDAVLFNYREQIGVMALRNRLPAASNLREFAEAGLLLTYGVDLRDLYRRAAVFVDKIFKGAKPADLPVEQPTKFELVINLKTAKALGLTVPPTLLGRADEVIE